MNKCALKNYQLLMGKSSHHQVVQLWEKKRNWNCCDTVYYKIPQIHIFFEASFPFIHWTYENKGTSNSFIFAAGIKDLDQSYLKDESFDLFYRGRLFLGDVKKEP